MRSGIVWSEAGLCRPGPISSWFPPSVFSPRRIAPAARRRGSDSWTGNLSIDCKTINDALTVGYSRGFLGDHLHHQALDVRRVAPQTNAPPRPPDTPCGGNDHKD